MASYNEPILSTEGLLTFAKQNSTGVSSVMRGWNTFVNQTGYEAGLFDFTPLIPSTTTPQTVTQRAFTLINGNYADMYVNIHQNGSFLRLTCAVILYRANGVEMGRFYLDGGYNKDRRYRSMVLLSNLSGYYWNAEETGETDAYRSDIHSFNAPMSAAVWNEFVEGAVDTGNPYQTLPVTDEGEGGYGGYDYSSDNDDFPALPTISVTGSGFVNMFKMNASGSASLADLASYLWSGLFDIDTYLRMFQNPMDCILSVGIVPVEPSVSAPLYIIVGNHATTLQAPRVNSQWYELDCGSITLDGKTYSNSFMDYSPYTKAELYLPYVGTVALNIDEIMDSTISIKYHIDLLSGSCVAYVKVSKEYEYKGSSHNHSNILYQYSGNVLTNIPITSQNFTQILQAVIGAVATGVGGGVASGATAGALGMESTQIAANAINVAESMKPSVSRSGNCSSACGLLGTQKPKLILTFPKIANAEDMNKERGFPTYIRKTLSSLVGSGYTKIDLAHLKNIPCTDSERTEILALLESGVEL